MLSFFPRGVLDEILNLIESVSEEFPSYSLITSFLFKYLINAKLLVSYTKNQTSANRELHFSDIQCHDCCFVCHLIRKFENLVTLR